MFALALQEHKAGHLAQAERRYRQILAQQPRHADAMHLLGVIAHQSGHHQPAVDLIQRAIAIKANFPEAFNNLGNALAALKREDAAVAAFRQALALKPNFPDALSNLANLLSNQGHREDAIAAYQRAIALQPDFADAYGNLGNVLRDQGHLDEAIAAYRRAIALKPAYDKAHFNLGNALRDKGQIDAAIAAYRQAVAINPNYAKAHLTLAAILHERGQFDEAIAGYQRAIAVEPDSAELYGNLANAWMAKEKTDDAIDAYRKAISLKPDFPEILANLANALTAKKQFDEAVALYRQAIALKADFPEALCNFANALAGQENLDEAIATLRQAIALDPQLAVAYSNLGNMLSNIGRVDEALAAYQQAIAIQPDYVGALCNLGNQYHRLNQMDRAIPIFREAIAIDPNSDLAHNHLSQSLLMSGQFPEGWKEYEWRWKNKDSGLVLPDFPQPLWDGRPLHGKKILLYAEQGFGDTLQFVRYAEMVAARGGDVALRCPPELVALLASAPGISRLVTAGQPQPPFDVHCPLLSLPGVFQTRIETIPNNVPYLKADPKLVEIWSRRLGDASAGAIDSVDQSRHPGDNPRDPRKPLRIAIAWAGRPAFTGDKTRSMKLRQLAPLATIPNITFYSLQKGPPAEQANTPPPGLNLINLGPDLRDFADTAAVMSLMDLILTTDTSIPHLAGALGLPVWTMLQFAPDWRWLLDRDDSPWYPTMRLFRQPKPGDWDSVMNAVTGAIMDWARQ
jgi:tetratricopeptide (TPR) repeat protein